MTYRFWAIGAIAAAFGLVVTAQTTRTPTPAPGVTHVVVDNMPPSVNARQEGAWTVEEKHSPPVRTGRRYTFTWPGGEQDVHTISSTRNDGWVQVDGAARWLNTAMAISVEELP
jgi:hypothetical protein